MKRKDPSLVIVAHIVGIIGGGLAILFGILGLVNNFIFSFLAILVGGFILIIELDEIIEIPTLKNPLYRGVTWVILGIIIYEVGWIPVLVVLASGILYLVYEFE